MWRPATKTGTNDVPIAAGKRRFGLPEEPQAPAAPSNGYSRPPASDIQFFNGRQEREREREPERPREEYRREERRDDYDHRRDDYRRDDRDDRERDHYTERGRERGGDSDRKERRWDDDRGREPEKPQDVAPIDEVPGMPVAVMGNVSQTELDNYAIHVRLEEINRKLRTGDVVPPDGQRSPTPPPSYDAYGRRANTRDIRYRKKLEDERMRLVDRAMKSDPNFRPPMDFGAQRKGRPQDKVYIPVKEFPEINFFGLLVGPRGNSLKNMERLSGAKISIRGKGSVKEGKGRPDAWAADEDDELHCLVMAEEESKVKACVNLINKVIETAASTPEGQNDHKRNQLRELASLNGTLRDDENQLCQNCGEKGDGIAAGIARRSECTAQMSFVGFVVEATGHMARDCRGRGDPNLAQNKQTAFDSEYSALMAELGEGGGGGGRPAGVVTAGPVAAAPEPEQRIPPWRLPENWMPNQRPGGAMAPPHPGFQQPYTQNAGYGYGGYKPEAGYPVAAAPGAADPYAAYYASMGQQAAVATA
ncbi:MAG: hypothetical protein TREMPRED_004589 [Tremellales sp. Tagirdzhanova-0007]|nr:MAG: hypothetical protein TREMPRED_004589 [Tremellales sp. Tagirdzhanova-0007]